MRAFFHTTTGALGLGLIMALAACQRNSPTSTAGSAADNLSPEPTAICQSAESSEYVLPYPVGTEYPLIQGFSGPYSHSGVFEYAFDFEMPIGSTVTAARGGQVIFIEESFSDDDVGTQNANMVIVQHEDGTYGRYVHLTHDGGLVEADQIVAQGDVIGLSGSSGYPAIPHLHFDVSEACPQSDCQTMPVCFSNTDTRSDGLVVGKSYTAEDYEK